VGSGGSVGTGRLIVGCGVGEGDADGTGVFVGAFVGPGDAVGGAADGEAVGPLGGVCCGGVAVRASVALGSVTAGGGRVCGDDETFVDAEGAAVVPAGPSPEEFCATRSCVRLNPARATPTASDGPSSTYRVKEARPVWPKALPPGFPSRPTLVDSSYRSASLDE
jgi:hypothetical protein